MTTLRSFLTREDEVRILAAIREAEMRTSGEVRVHVEEKFKGEPFERAEWWFHKLKMHKTAERNSVIVYICLQSKMFAIFGDKGIHEKVGAAFWQKLVMEMENNFRDGRVTEGIIETVHEISDALAMHFPYQKETDVNELSDEVSYS
jgi:uncharacterized membrane protein